MSEINGTEWVGPPDALEEVSGQSDRTLILRSIDGVLRLHDQMGRIMRELGAAADDRLKTRALVANLEMRLNATQDDLKRAPSQHDMAEEAAKAAEITASHKIQELKLDIAKQQLSDLQTDQREIKRVGLDLRREVTGGLIVAFVLAVAGALWQVLHK